MMTKGKSAVMLMVSFMLTLMILSCQQEGKTDNKIDKDEEHSLVLAQELTATSTTSISVPMTPWGCPITRSRISSAIARAVSG